MSRLFRPPSFDHLNNIQWEVQDVISHAILFYHSPLLRHAFQINNYIYDMSLL